MANRYGSSSSYSSQGGGGGSSTQGGLLFGRVKSVILDSFHPDYDKFGKSLAINGIIYSKLGEGVDEEDDDALDFAYQGNTNIKKVPLPGEIVLLQGRISPGRADAKPTDLAIYWVDIINTWNHPHHNAYPDTLQFGPGDNDFGDDFEEQSKVNPLQPFYGDTYIESRYGSSIRFTGTKHDSSPWIDDSNNGLPLTIIRNGQVESENGNENVLEDVNEDASSIYMTSDHTVELEQANEKREAWEEEPEKADAFKGAQIIINSNRLYFNAREESALISAKEAFGVNAKTVNLDGEDYLAADAKKIYLGVEAFREAEPVLLGATSTDWMADHLGLFKALVSAMASAPPVPAAYVAKMKATANAIKPQIPPLKNRLPNLHSKKVFTE